ncbi:hypothetical protein K493DRAFT_380241 [Basidiobolus meristosporus CBS 931.73]|uniref:Uncharacterized protein n=1 Tax=Basidiobolus meristosporus CBS 931.73 TaxID=1314790 RepID=A0A1Y1XY84_9FUNG|nr:hypothetical protein K493DRAFT_380241 [Basidiobolus meristosporus CBS 931.73]|eukprot:ORX90699.1 hypothetical protein K493DRAFT_380241 [Basidiobolus meristosporus CBS 931.73]
MTKKPMYSGYLPFHSTDDPYSMEKELLYKGGHPPNRSSRLRWVMLIMTVALLGAVALRLSSPAVNNPPVEFTIVTAASKNHFCPLQGFLYSLKDSLKLLPAYMRPRVLVYDLGLGNSHHTAIRNMMAEGMLDELHTFNYSSYPSFWDVTVNRGEYAWKIGIIREVTQRYPGVVLWMDSGNRAFPRFFVDVVEHVQSHGFYSPLSSGNVRQWMHPGMPQYYNDDIEKYAEERNCNGAFVAVDSKNQAVMASIVNPWFGCALDKKCIAPDGSSRLNHRQDQAALTYLTLTSPYRCSYERLTGLLMHQDGDCERLIEAHWRRKQM